MSGTTQNISSDFLNQGLETRRRILDAIAQELAAKSKRWKALFEMAKLENLEAWQVLSWVYSYQAGSNLSGDFFVYARVAKLVATTERFKIDETLLTRGDLVGWNRQAILAMIEAEKKNQNDQEKIEKGYQAIELINILYPESLIESPKSSPYPRW